MARTPTKKSPDKRVTLSGTLAAGMTMSAMIVAGLFALFIAFAATFCIENCPDRYTPRSLGAMFIALLGLIILVCSPFVAARISGRRHWMWAGLGAIAGFILVIVLAAPLPSGFGNMESLMVAAFSVASMLALRPPDALAVAIRCVFVIGLLALWMPRGPSGTSYGKELSVLIPIAFGLLDRLVRKASRPPPSPVPNSPEPRD